MTKVQLIHPGNDVKYKHLKTGYSSYPPPSGLEIIASYVERCIPKIRFEIFDGNVTSHNEILQRLDADVVGITDWFTSHSNAMEIARVAKIKNPNSKIVIGGPNASNLGERILLNNPEVDFVAFADGERTLTQIIQNDSSAEIRNVWFRGSDRKIHFSSGPDININDLGLFDFEHLYETDMRKYDSKEKSYFDEIDMTPIPISSIRGCIKAVKYGSCTYCTIPMTNGVRVMQPNLVWRQIRHLYEKYGIRKFFETGDSFTIGNYPEKLLEAKPKDLDVSFRIYANPDTISLKNISILKSLGVQEIFIGIETVDKDILQLANKNYDTSSIEKTVQLLEEYQIRVFLPFLFGLPGETYNSVNGNYDFAQYLISKYSNIDRLLISLAIPLIGSKWFDTLLKDDDIVTCYNEGGLRSLATDDNIEYERLFLLSLHKYCHLSFGDIYTILQKPLSQNLKGRIGGFGCLEKYVVELENEILV
ncbi:MAG: radical SAM protein [Bacteroidota bacterium]|nr:radical SAM protein [Bacteroidota bacterium]